MHVLCAMCTQYGGGQKREFSPLELELRLVVSCHGGARTQTLVLWKIKPVLLLLSCLASLPLSEM